MLLKAVSMLCKAVQADHMPRCKLFGSCVDYGQLVQSPAACGVELSKMAA